LASSGSTSSSSSYHITILDRALNQGNLWKDATFLCIIILKCKYLSYFWCSFLVWRRGWLKTPFTHYPHTFISLMMGVMRCGRIGLDRILWFSVIISCVFVFCILSLVFGLYYHYRWVSKVGTFITSHLIPSKKFIIIRWIEYTSNLHQPQTNNQTHSIIYGRDGNTYT